ARRRDAVVEDVGSRARPYGPAEAHDEVRDEGGEDDAGGDDRPAHPRRDAGSGSDEDDERDVAAERLEEDGVAEAERPAAAQPPDEATLPCEEAAVERAFRCDAERGHQCEHGESTDCNAALPRAPARVRQ